MNVYQLYGKIGPWATPAPAAIALAGRLFGEWVHTDKLTAWTIAIFSLAALEVAGGLCSYQMIRTSLSHRWGWFFVCLLGVLTYIGLGIYALWGLTAWIYVVLAVFVHIAVAAELVSVQERHEVIEDNTLALQVEKERTKQIQAEARKAKAEHTQPTTYLTQAYVRKPVEIKPCLCGEEFTRSQDKAIHARRCEVWKAHKAKPNE